MNSEKIENMILNEIVKLLQGRHDKINNVLLKYIICNYLFCFKSVEQKEILEYCYRITKKLDLILDLSKCLHYNNIVEVNLMDNEGEYCCNFFTEDVKIQGITKEEFLFFVKEFKKITDYSRNGEVICITGYLGFNGDGL